MTKRRALVVGASGIVGLALVDHLRRPNDGEDPWEVFALARRPPTRDDVTKVAVDLRDGAAVDRALAEVRPTHVFFATWMRQPTEAENIDVNRTLVRNVLTPLERQASVEHVALVTGLKHYLGPFESYGKGNLPSTPFREAQPRLDVPNFYYAQEDEVFAFTARTGAHFSVHRPHTIIGLAPGNAMNMGTTLAAYASLCRETGRSFMFPGSAVQWRSLTDMTDARLLAKHLEWAATTPAAFDQAFNVVNGDIFRWSWMWPKLAGYFGLEAAPFDPNHDGVPLQTQLQDAAPEWTALAKKHGLAEPDLGGLVSPWHTDADLGRPLEVVADMTKSRLLGFHEYRSTAQSFFDLFDALRRARLIP